jgi:three-Cys-motif partner protein
MRKKKAQPDLACEPLLFELPEQQPDEIRVDQLKHPVWTENKAKLIERYLYYFVLVTKHGTYIDGFAGPQRPNNPEMWAANLVLESEPQRLRHFYLFDESADQVQRLKHLRKIQPSVNGRTIEIYKGDFNAKVRTLLRKRGIKETEATFCLLDQRTFECHWKTLAELAKYKGAGRPKIELFYFLAVSWLPRALSAVRNKKLLQQWWGRDDWACLKRVGVDQIKEMIIERFKSELGYKSVKAWPIYDRKGSEFVVYYMIHATDHEEAPKLMARAYNEAVQPAKVAEQLSLGLVLNGQSNASH